MTLAAANALLQKLMPALAPLSLLGGLLFGSGLASGTWLVPWIFSLMTFTAGLALEAGEFRRIAARPLFLPASLVLLHVFMPLLALALSRLLGLDDDTTLALVIIALTPAGTTAVVWVGAYGGNLSLAFSVIMADTLAVPLLIPAMLGLLAGVGAGVQSAGLFATLFWMLLFPSLLAATAQKLSGGAARRVLAGPLGLLSKLGIIAILLINGGAAAAYFQHVTWALLGRVLLVFSLCCAGYAVGFIGARLLLRDKADVIAFTICCGLRNVSAGAALAILYFSPLTAFTVILGMLFQQILGCLGGMTASRLLDRFPAFHSGPVPPSTRRLS